MNTKIHDGNFATASPSSPARFSRPFQNDAGAYILEQDFIVDAASYTPLALSTAHGTHSDYRLVAELPPQHIGNALLQFTRRYAKVPSARSEFESYSATFPAIAPAKFRINLSTVAAAADSTYSGTPTSIIETSGAHGLAANDQVLIYYVARSTSSGVTIDYAKSVARKVLNVPSSTTFHVGRIVDNGTISITGVSVGSIGRASFSQTVASRIDFAYYLPGVTPAITTTDDIPIIQPTSFSQIVDEYGERTGTLSEYTTPTEAAYRALFGTWVAAEPSSISVWMGNIYERVTRYVRAA